MKLGSFIVMLITMMLVMEFIGLPTGLGTILNKFGISVNQQTHELINADIGDSYIFNYIFGDGTGVLIILLGSGALLIGLFARGYDPSLVILPIITTIAVLFISTFWSIIKYTQTLNEMWITSLVGTIFIALGAAFIFSCIDYFAGR